MLLRTLISVKQTALLMSTVNRQLSFHKMNHRGLIGVRGDTKADFLQGLITNDVHLLDDTKKSAFMFSLFLNAKGRVLSDAFVYRIIVRDKEPHYLIECDNSVKGKLVKLLNFYNLHKKVTVWEESDVDVWAALPDLGSCLSEASSWTRKPIPTNGILFFAPDPRAVPGWSGRVLQKVGTDVRAPFGISSDDTVCEKKEANRYQRARYRLGLAEGPDELKSGVGLPLESNADLCGGVSFSKGCYIGQELTARSRFTGIIRRRVAPIHLNRAIDRNILSVDAPIYRISVIGERIGRRPIGWLRGLEDPPANQPQSGIALLRLSDTAEAVIAKHLLWMPTSGETIPEDHAGPVNLDQGVVVHPFIPNWWPSDIITDSATLATQLKVLDDICDLIPNLEKRVSDLASLVSAMGSCFRFQSNLTCRIENEAKPAHDGG